MQSNGSGRFVGAHDLMDMIRQLPTEIRMLIYDWSNLLTKYLHHELPLPISRPIATQILIECFQSNSIDILSNQLFNLEMSFETMFVTSKEMWDAANQLSRVPGYELIANTSQCLNDVDWTIDTHSVRGIIAKLCMPTIDPVTLRLLNEALDLFMANSTQDSGVSTKVLECATGLGRVDLVKKMLSHQVKPSWHAFLFAGLHGHMEILQMLCDYGTGHCLTAYGAVAGGHVEIVKHINDLGSEHIISESAIQFALGCGKTAAVWWLLKDQTYWTHTAFDDIKNISASMGDLDLLQYAVEHDIGGPLTFDGVDGAAKHGFLRCIQWIYANSNATGSQQALEFSAEHGHLEIFIWLCENTALKPHEEDMLMAARHGHRWLIEYYTKSIAIAPVNALLEAALESGQVEIADVLFESGCATPCLPMIERITTSGNIAGMTWLHDHLDITQKCSADKLQIVSF
ncbi:hypothetical protein BDV3_003625 [Batrachochytrium dendrobatidis]|nr:hypothetical protein QVD99_003904 [Batrachochytrium dendrobatidis]